MHHASWVVLIATAAFLLPLLAARLRVPAVVLEIAFGILVGPHLLGWIEGGELLDFLAEFGFFLLMFLSGFEIDFYVMGRQGPRRLGAGLGIFVFTLVLCFAFALAIGQGVFITLLLATTSVGLVIPTLRNTRRAGTPLGQLVLIAALLADLLTLVGVTFYALIVQGGWGWNLLKIPALFGISALVLLVARRAVWWHPERFQRLFDRDDPEELGIRTCLALMFLFVGLCVILGVEAILGAFFAGMIFAVVFRNPGALHRQLTGFSYGFLIPIFFINVGIRFDLAALLEPSVIWRALLLIGAALLVKVLPAMLFLVRSFPPREAFAAGILLSARLSLVIAVAELGVRLGLLSRAMEAAVIVLAIVTSTLAPTLFRALMPPLPHANRGSGDR